MGQDGSKPASEVKQSKFLTTKKKKQKKAPASSALGGIEESSAFGAEKNVDGLISSLNAGQKYEPYEYAERTPHLAPVEKTAAKNVQLKSDAENVISQIQSSEYWTDDMARREFGDLYRVIVRLEANDPDLDELVLKGHPAFKRLDEETRKSVQSLIANALQENTVVKRIDLSETHLDDNFAITLSLFLMNNSSMISLDLSNNHISGMGISALASMLGINETLHEFKINNQTGDFPVTEEGEDAFLMSLKTNTKLQHLELDTVDPKKQEEINQLLARNRTLKPDQIKDLKKKVATEMTAKIPKTEKVTEVPLTVDPDAPVVKQEVVRLTAEQMKGDDPDAAKEPKKKMDQSQTKAAIQAMFQGEGADIVRQRKAAEAEARRLEEDAQSQRDKLKAKGGKNAALFAQIDNLDEYNEIFSKARWNKPEDIKKILDAGCDVDFEDEFGNSPLLVACQNGNKACVELLLAEDADIDHQNYQGNTALHFCYTFGFPDLGKFLEEKGADKSIKNNYGRTAIEWQKK